MLFNKITGEFRVLPFLCCCSTGAAHKLAIFGQFSPRTEAGVAIFGQFSPRTEAGLLRSQGDFWGVEPQKSRGAAMQNGKVSSDRPRPLRRIPFDCSNAVKGGFAISRLARFWRRRAAKNVGAGQTKRLSTPNPNPFSAFLAYCRAPVAPAGLRTFF